MPAVAIYNDRPMDHRIYWLSQFQSGLRRHGLMVEIQHPRDYQPSDLAVFWGANQTRIITEQRKAGADYLVIERGFVRRMEYASFGFNGLNGMAEFQNENSPSDRWTALNVELKPWKTSGEYVLLGGQVPNDASLHGVNAREVYPRLAKELANMHRRPVYWRPHPLHRRQLDVPLPQQDMSLSLADALAGAWAVVVLSSNLSVDATIAGVPCVTLDPRSMAYSVTRHELMYSLIPRRPDRRQWAWNLAYAQWNADEVAQGLAWEHLKKRYY